LDYTVEIQELDGGQVVESEGFRVIAARVEHAGLCLGYRVEEDERRGNVDLEKAKAAGIPPGPDLGRLIDQGSIVVNGRTVRKEEIIGPTRPGRALVYSGDTRPCASIAKLAKNADLLIHEATFTSELQAEAIARAHSTAGEAAQVARDAGVKKLALTHLSPRHQETPDLILRDARAVFPDCFVPSDLESYEVPLSHG
jgi:ribonuclease Z